MGHYVQDNDATWRIPYFGGLCEGYKEGAWGQATLPFINRNGDWETDGPFPTAMAAWDAEPNKHYDLPPAGITVPVYFSLGSTGAGHTAINLDDLHVASSTQGGYHNIGYLHSNIQNLIDLYAEYNNGCTYLGWGENVGRIRVVHYEPDITTQDITQTDPVAFTEVTQDDPTSPVGTSKTVQIGTNGSHTVVTRVTYADGIQTGSEVISDTTVPATSHIISIGSDVTAPSIPPVTDPTIPSIPPIETTTTEPTLPSKPWYQPFVDFLIYLFKNLIAGVK